MIIKHNQDDSFFAVKSDKIPLGLMSADTRSITIKEDAGKMITGSIELLDRYNTYINMFSYNAEIDIAFGYKGGISLSNVFNNISALSLRTGLRALLMNPEHEMKDNGEKITKFNFRSGYGMTADRNSYNYEGKTRFETIKEVFERNAISDVFIKFPSMSEKAMIRQTNESDFSFLRNLSKKLRTRFQVYSNSSGGYFAIFCDEASLDEARIKNKSFNIQESSADYLFEWGGGLSNVYSAKCVQNVGENGTGDMVRIVMIDGDVVTQRSSASVKRFQTVKLNTALLKEDMKRVQNKYGYAAAAKFYSAIISAEKISDPKIARYWTPVEQSTAPDTAGIEVTIRARGNPLYIPSGQSILGFGFPDFYRSIYYYIRTINHTIGSSYENSILLKDRMYG